MMCTVRCGGGDGTDSSTSYHEELLSPILNSSGPGTMDAAAPPAERCRKHPESKADKPAYQKRIIWELFRCFFSTRKSSLFHDFDVSEERSS